MNAITDPFNIERTAIDGAVHLPVTLLSPSPTNPRKRFDKAHLDELAESLRKHGVLQPILARPIAGAKSGEPLYEIVAGERRWRASQLAELTSIPVLLRSMTDFEVLELQVIENLQRDDLHAIEEAEGFSALLRKGDGLQGYASVDELAARIGKSRRHVYNRLKLLDLVPAAREACLEGRLQPTVALLLAAMTQEDQPKAMKELLAGWGGEPFSRRQAAEHLHRNYMLVLSSAPFKTADGQLVPAAGSCKECPKRTGANPDLFEDIKNGDTCTDVRCFQLKAETHRENVKAAAQAEGVEVISGKEAKKLLPQSYSSEPDGYLLLDKVHYAIGEKPLGKLLGKDAPAAVLIEHPHTHELLKAVPRDAAIKVLKSKGIVKQSKLPSAEERKRKAEVDASNAWRTETTRRVLDAVMSPDLDGPGLAALMWPEVAMVMWDRLCFDDMKRCAKLIGWSAERSKEQTEKAVRALGMQELGRLIVLMCLAGDLHVGTWSSDKSSAPRLKRFAAHFGVDIAQVRRDLAAGKKAGPAAAKKPKAKDATEAFTEAHAEAPADEQPVAPPKTAKGRGRVTKVKGGAVNPDALAAAA